jgi:hypothetical protein
VSVTVSAMQTRMLSILAQGAGQAGVTSDQLLADINRVYRFDIPEEVRGGRFRQQLSVTVPAATSARVDVNTSGLTIAPANVQFGAILGDWARTLAAGQTVSVPLTVYTDPSRFFSVYDPAVTSQVTVPDAILIEETSFTLRPVPSVNQTVYFDALVYRAALGSSDSITLDFEELAIVYGACGYAAIRLGDDDVLSRMREFGNEQMDKLRGNSARSSAMSVVPAGDF